MRPLFSTVIILAGLAGGLLAEGQQKKRPVKKQVHTRPELGDEVLVNSRKPKTAPKKGVKWEGPDLDAAKSQRQRKGKNK